MSSGFRQLSSRTVAVLVGLVVLLIGGSGFIYYDQTIYRPNKTNADATAQAQTMGTAHVQASSTALRRAQVAATATSVAAAETADLQNMYDKTTRQTSIINGPLSHSDKLVWSEVKGSTGNDCAFIEGAYHASAPASSATPCFATATNFSNFAFEIQMTIVSGHSGGIIFRASSNGGNYYQFRINTDGTYVLNKISTDSHRTLHSLLLVSGPSSVIKIAHNQLNLLAVIARGSNIYLYINRHYVNSVRDSNYKSGSIGVNVVGDMSGVVEAVFSHVQVWKL